MKNKQQPFLGLIITLIIFILATLIIRTFLKDYSYPISTSITLSVELLLSILAIQIFKPNFNIKIPKMKPALKVFFIGFGISVLTMIILNLVEMLIMGETTKEKHPAFNKMTLLQIIFFVFIGASIAEEFLFRGFLLNMLMPLKKVQFRIFKKQIGLHIILSAIMFGAAHLMLLKSGVSTNFVLKIVVFATILGLFAGYFQEKYKNTSYAILTHMGGNLLGVIGMLIMQFVELP